MLSAIYNGTKNVPVLHVIVKLDVDFEWSYITLCIFYKELLHSLDKDGDT